jgi:hypothetical protein
MSTRTARSARKSAPPAEPNRLATAASRKQLMADLQRVLDQHGVPGRLSEIAIQSKPAPATLAATTSETIPTCKPTEMLVQTIRRIGGSNVVVWECRPRP